jgi:methyltransferase (TIGR00027 family)
MKLPNCSNMMRIGQLRHIQSVVETGERRNPDTLVRYLLSPAQELGCLWRSRVQLSHLRADPFYHYVIARTKYYDDLFVSAIRSGVKSIVNLGCGSDTRSYRFVELLRENGVAVAECDQFEAIETKQKAATRLWPTGHVDYLGADLNTGTWPDLDRWLEGKRGTPVFILMEGVSPYIATDAFGRFLDFLSDRLVCGSSFAYDFKVSGKADTFGRSQNAADPFRLPAVPGTVSRFHEAHGFHVERMEQSDALAMRLLPSLSRENLFTEDCLLELVR